MKSVKDLRRRATKREQIIPRVYSTSEARANFAAALETAQLENAVIGFDRYGRTVAALVPIGAVYMLAGLGDRVPASVRRSIQSDAKQFVRNGPSHEEAMETPSPKRARGPAKKKRAKKAAKKAGRGRSGRG